MPRKYKARGVMIRIGTDDNFLFHNRTRIHGMGSEHGVSVAIRWGVAYFPVPLFWANGWRAFFRSEWPKAMHGEDYWFVMKFPVIGPWISAKVGRYAFYAGLKMIHWHPDYISWVDERDWVKFRGDGNGNNTVLQISGRISDSGGR